MTAFQVRPLGAEDGNRARRLVAGYFGTSRMVTRGRLVETADAPGFLAWLGGEPVGIATYEISGGGCEVLVLLSLVQGAGIGSALIAAVRAAAFDAGCERLWLVTTNDNTPALRFYQRRGFQLVALYPNALEESRQLKPEIPLIGLDGIPLRDEIELEMRP